MTDLDPFKSFVPKTLIVRNIQRKHANALMHTPFLIKVSSNKKAHQGSQK
jgi:hypothetical protein